MSEPREFILHGGKTFGFEKGKHFDNSHAQIQVCEIGTEGGHLRPDTLDLHVIEKSSYDALAEENEALKRMFSSLNKYVMPGDTDSGDSARKVYDELRLCKQELLEALRSIDADRTQTIYSHSEEFMDGANSAFAQSADVAREALEKWDKK